MNGHKSTSPKISVVMAVYNSERFLKESIESILSQTLTDFEFVIVDDGSTDNTADIIQSFNDSRIRYFCNEHNIGQTKSLNIGIRQSRAPYIARMDADDVAYPERLSKQIQFLEENPHIAVVGSWTRLMSEKGKERNIFKTPIESNRIRCYLAGSGELSYYCLFHPTVLMRRSALDDVGYYKEEGEVGKGYPQDFELWSRMVRKYEFANIGEPLLKYRVLPESDSRIDREKQNRAVMEVNREKIQHYWPDCQEQDVSILSKMLSFFPQESNSNGRKALLLFEGYMKNFLGEQNHSILNRETISQMKLYYIPQLFVTNKGQSILEAFKLIARYPLFLFDQKFYRKIAKAAQQNLFQKV